MPDRLTLLRTVATSVAVALTVLGSPAGLASGAEPASARPPEPTPSRAATDRPRRSSARRALPSGRRPDVALAAPRRRRRLRLLDRPRRPARSAGTRALPIRWTANTAQAPAGGLAVLQESVARIAQLTGTTWQYVGPSTSTPTTAYLPKQSQADYPPVLLGWTDGAGSDLLAGQPRSVLGMTRTAWFGVQRPDGSKVAAIRSAVVALDRTDTLPLRGATSWKALVLHELGHVMGLAHVEDRSQLMATVLPASPDVQAGDVAGLTRSAGAPAASWSPSPVLARTAARGWPASRPTAAGAAGSAAAGPPARRWHAPR
jgi:hypothetical protein